MCVSTWDIGSVETPVMAQLTYTAYIRSFLPWLQMENADLLSNLSHWKKEMANIKRDEIGRKFQPESPFQCLWYRRRHSDYF